MNERRTEQRFMCSDLVTVQLENQSEMLVANLEDISPSGACLGMQQAVAKDVIMTLHCPSCRFRGKVRYCVFNESGYQVGIQLMECKWSKQTYEPKHLLEEPVVGASDLESIVGDPAKAERLLADVTAASKPEAALPCTAGAGCGKRRSCCDEETCPRADISRLMEPESPISERVQVVARAVAWTCEELSPEQIRQCFSRWFQLPPECALCDEFIRSYQAEYTRASNRPVQEKTRTAGAHNYDF